MAFTYLKVKSAKCLCLLTVVLICYFGLGLGLKNLVLFTSLPMAQIVIKSHLKLAYLSNLFPPIRDLDTYEDIWLHLQLMASTCS